jgi:hypothetical protein
MAMKETAGSLRGYFLLAGIVSVLMALRDNSNLSAANLAALTGGQKAALYIPIVTRIALGCGFVFAGIKFQSALLTGGAWIKKMLIVSGALLFINGALLTAEFGIEPARSGIIGALIGLAITIYLYRSITRLAAEAAAKAGIAPPPPKAKVIS